MARGLCHFVLSVLARLAAEHVVLVGADAFFQHGCWYALVHQHSIVRIFLANQVGVLAPVGVSDPEVHIFWYRFATIHAGAQCQCKVVLGKIGAQERVYICWWKKGVVFAVLDVVCRGYAEVTACARYSEGAGPLPKVRFKTFPHHAAEQLMNTFAVWKNIVSIPFINGDIPAIYELYLFVIVLLLIASKYRK